MPHSENAPRCQLDVLYCWFWSATLAGAFLDESQLTEIHKRVKEAAILASLIFWTHAGGPITYNWNSVAPADMTDKILRLVAGDIISERLSMQSWG